MKTLLAILLLASCAHAAQRDNPYTGNPTAAAAGRKLYARHCESCHGKDAKGGTRSPALSETGKLPPAVLFDVITNGRIRRGMPSWSFLPEPQRWQIVTWLQSLQSR